MVKIEINGREVACTFDGGARAVAMELGAAISGIFQGMQNMDQFEAERFKVYMRACVAEGSPVWTTKHELTQIVIPQKKSDAPTDQS